MLAAKNNTNNNNMSPAVVVTPEQVSAFRRDGAVLLPGAFKHQVDLLRAGVEANLAAPSAFAQRIRAEEGGYYFNDYFNWRRIREFQDLVFHSPAAEIAAALMGTDRSLFYHEHVLVKSAGSASLRTPWHHDQSYYPVDGDDLVSLWVPVDAVDAASSLRFVAGSHAWGRWFVPRMFDGHREYDGRRTMDGRLYESVPEEDILSGKWPVLGWGCQPGDCVAFHGRTLHAAEGNAQSSASRRVVSLRFCGPSARLADRPWTPSPPVYGGLRAGQRLEEAANFFPVVYRRRG